MRRVKCKKTVRDERSDSTPTSTIDNRFTANLLTNKHSKDNYCASDKHSNVVTQYV